MRFIVRYGLEKKRSDEIENPDNSRTDTTLHIKFKLQNNKLYFNTFSCEH